ncbi:MAG: putative manganese-dependent inorganic diphosphatase [Eggerthellales bacterium]|nr:putative manganese-dependent inorganic diphosphatase [Eggerthellales bacterium]
MQRPILVVGHKNPDNDSIASAVAYAYFKNEMAKKNNEVDADGDYLRYVPVRLGPLPPESKWVLQENGIDAPKVIAHVHARVSDVMTRNPITVNKNLPLIEAGKILRAHNVRALVVDDDEGKYQGLFTMRMVAHRYLEATDLAGTTGLDTLAVANSLVSSLSEKVEDIMETDVLTLNKDGLLSEAVEDLMNSSLREAVVLDDEGCCIGIVTRSDIAKSPRRKVILVDHNESTQAANGIKEAEVVEVIDHHRIGDITSSNPIRFMNLPLGSTATIITLQFRQNDIEIPQHIAAVLLSAILTDTVIMKSPTTTQVDRDQVEYLAGILGVDATEFGLQVFQCRGEDATMPVEEIVGADAKEFDVADAHVLIAQHETVALQTLLNREEEIRQHMRKLVEANNYDFVLLLLTDILAEGSQFVVEGNTRMVDRVFGIDSSSGSVWMPGILSRKKQVASKILA